MRKKNKYHKSHNKTMMSFALEYIHDRITRYLPYMYSAVALAMWNLVDGNEEEKYDAIMDMIAESNRVWNDIVESGKDVVEECERITGVCIRDEVSRKEE